MCTLKHLVLPELAGLPGRGKVLQTVVFAGCRREVAGLLLGPQV